VVPEIPLVETVAPATACPPFVAVRVPVSVGPEGAGTGTGAGTGVGVGEGLGVVEDPHATVNHAITIAACFIMDVLPWRRSSAIDRLPVTVTAARSLTEPFRSVNVLTGRRLDSI
jgi:hypothetical protein